MHLDGLGAWTGSTAVLWSLVSLKRVMAGQYRIIPMRFSDSKNLRIQFKEVDTQNELLHALAMMVAPKSGTSSISDFVDTFETK